MIDLYPLVGPVLRRLDPERAHEITIAALKAGLGPRGGVADDPILRTQYEIKEIPQITNIQFWRGVGGGTTSERGNDSDVVHFRAIRDDHGRVMVLMSHNTDVADSWEREGEDADFFYQFSPRGYALGVNVLLHAMTH